MANISDVNTEQKGFRVWAMVSSLRTAAAPTWSTDFDPSVYTGSNAK